MSVTGSTDDREGHHRKSAAYPQVEDSRPVLVDGDLADPVCPWQPPGEHLGHVDLAPEQFIGGHLGDQSTLITPGRLDVQADPRGHGGGSRQVGQRAVVAVVPGIGL
jgi:hypothetical protein